MSECDRIQPMLSALVDGELSHSDSQDANKHLLSCRSCKREWESLVDLDEQLTKAIVASDVEQKCGAIAQQVPTPVQRENSDELRWPLVVIAFAVAATLLLALLPFFQEKRLPTPKPVLVARLVRSTGPVQILRPGETDWAEAWANSQDSLLAGSRVKTDVGVLCELQTAAKGMLRLSESADVILVEPNHVELVAGKLWCLASDSTTIDVSIAPIESKTPLIFACPSSAELQCVVEDSFASCDSLSLNNANATLSMGEFSITVAPGESVSIDHEQKIDRRMVADSTTKIWQLPLLALGAETDRELVSLLDRILAPIGRTKATSMNEEQVRMLGSSGAIPLLAYAVAESKAENLHLRRTALQLASELADDRGVRLLQRLASDPDKYIAQLAKATLARIESTH